MKNTKQPQVGLGVFVEWDGKICLGKRKKAHGEGKWSLPGGHLEFFESWEECACRETEEETGLELGSTIFVTATNNLFQEQLHYVTIFMWAFYGGGSTDPEDMLREPDKCEGWRWFSPRDLEELNEPMFGPLESMFKLQMGDKDGAAGMNRLFKFMLPKIGK